MLKVTALAMLVCYPKFVKPVLLQGGSFDHSNASEIFSCNFFRQSGLVFFLSKLLVYERDNIFNGPQHYLLGGAKMSQNIRKQSLNLCIPC